MKSLEFDIETFAKVDLSKCGVYRYAEDPSFEIILFGYSVDGGPIIVVDIASGEKLPPEIIDLMHLSQSPMRKKNMALFLMKKLRT